MGFILILPFLAAAYLAIRGTVRQLILARAGANWWAAFGILALAGAGLGVWLAVGAHIKPAATLRLRGVPVPVAITTKVEETWTVVVPPAPIRYGAMAADFFVGIAACLAPLLLASLWSEMKRKRALAD